MIPGIIDYCYAKELLNRVNRAVGDANILTTPELQEGWQAIQTPLFSQFKQYSIYKKAPAQLPFWFRLGKKIRNFFLWCALTVLHHRGIARIKKQSGGVLIFSVDVANSPHKGDRRIGYIHNFCEAEKIPYTEIFHTTLATKSLKNARERKRAALYLEVGTTITKLFVLPRVNSFHRSIMATIKPDTFTEEERIFLSQAIRNIVPTVLALPRQKQWLTQLLKKISIWAVFGIDDSRHYHALGAACREIGIPFYAFQHGHYTPYHVGWLRALPHGSSASWRPQHLVVWSEYWKQELLKCGSVFTESDIEIGGYHETLLPFPRHEHNETLNILVPYEIDTRDVVAKYIREIEKDPRITVYLKTRPDMPEATQRAEYLGDEPGSRLQIAPDVKKILPTMDIVIGTFSTLLYDCLGYGKPIAVLEVPDFEFGKGLLDNDVAERIVGDRDTTFERLQAITKVAEMKFEERRARVFGATPLLVQDWLRKMWSDSLKK